MDFWSQFWPQLSVALIGLCFGIPITLFATFLGVGLGIPAGLYLEGRIEKRTGKVRKAKILSAIREELEINVSYLTNYKAHLEGRETRTLTTIRNETWIAFREGGELEWIRDPTLLNQLASVYFFINLVNHMSEKVYEMVLRFNMEKAEGQLIYLIETIDDLLEEIDKLLKLI
jgi:hypothetical protein